MRSLLLISVLAGFLLGACGYKGALYLPNASAPASASAPQSKIPAVLKSIP